MNLARWLLVAALTVLAATATPAVARAASVTVAFSPDPTEDVSVTVTASGTADVSTRLYVFAIVGSSACPATASGLSYAYELSGGGPWFGGGDAVAAGAFSRSYTYKPNDATAYRICAYLSATTSVPPQASDARLLMPREPAALVAITESSDPTEEKPVTYSVTGSTEVDRKLYVFAMQPSSWGCPARASGLSYANELSGGGPWFGGGDAIAAGPFERTYSYTPRDSGSVQVCAYVSETTVDTPNATASRTTSVREPAALVAIAESSDPTEEKPVTYSVTGSTEVDRKLYVFAMQPSSSGCPARASGLSYANELSGGGPWFGGGDAIAAGAFERTYRYAPRDSGDVQVCAYVSETTVDTPNATASRTTSVREPTASLTVTAATTGTRGHPVSVAVSGNTERARKLYVFATPSSGECPARASGASYAYELSGGGPWFGGGDDIVEGPVSRTYSFTPARGGTYRICAYITESSPDTPNASAAATVEVHDPDAPPPAPPTPSAWKLDIDVPATVQQGERVAIRLAGQAMRATSLLTFVSPSSTTCKRTAEAHAGSAGVKAVASGPQAAGGIATSASFGPAAAGAYRVCAYLTSEEDDVPQKTAMKTFTILPDPALVPVLVSDSDEEHRDRLVLVWKRGANDENDAITVFLGDPAAGAEAHWSGAVDGGDARVSRPGSNYRAVLPHIGYRKFWWTITRPGPYRSNTVSEVRTARVVPRPMDKTAARVTARLRLGKSSKRPGNAHVVVRSSPRAKVSAVLRHAGRAVKRWTFTGNFEARNTLRVSLSCATRGPYRMEVVMADPYGARVMRRVSWNITDRCVRLQAAERRRAEARRRAAERRREAERRRREEERRRNETPAPPSSGGGNPYPGMTCSEIGHDFWVAPGSDPEHDADGDGHACESYA